MISIRPANEQDATTCSRVLCSSIKELCVKDHRGDAQIVRRWTANKDKENLSRWITDVHSKVYVAEYEGVVCGVGAIGRDGEITLNYVSPRHRFQGVSKILLSELEAKLRAAGFKSARLISTETAYSFYRAVGWVDSGEPGTWLGMKNYPMMKNL